MVSPLLLHWVNDPTPVVFAKWSRGSVLWYIQQIVSFETTRKIKQERSRRGWSCGQGFIYVEIQCGKAAGKSSLNREVVSHQGGLSSSSSSFMKWGLWWSAWTCNGNTLALLTCLARHCLHANIVSVFCWSTRQGETNKSHSRVGEASSVHSSASVLTLSSEEAQGLFDSQDAALMIFFFLSILNKIKWLL